MKSAPEKRPRKPGPVEIRNRRAEASVMEMVYLPRELMNEIRRRAARKGMDVVEFIEALLP